MTTSSALVLLRQTTERRIELGRVLRSVSRDCVGRTHAAVEQSRLRIAEVDALLLQLPRPSILPQAASEPVIPEMQDPPLQRVSERKFRNESVQMDGKHFVDCELIDCTLEYGGGQVTLQGTNFEGCQFRFHSEAALTMMFFKCFGLMNEGSRSFGEDSGPKGPPPPTVLN